MNEPAVPWLSEILRATAALSISAVVVAGLMRLLKITSPRAQRLACGLVLFQGWLVVHPRLELPWGESRPISSLAAASHDALAASQSRAIVEPAIEPRAPTTVASNGANELDLRFAEKDRPRRSAASTARMPAARPDGDRPWGVVFAQVALAVWAAGGLTTVALLLASYLRFVRSVGCWLPIAPEWLDEWRQVLAERPIGRRVELRVTVRIGPLACWTPRGYQVLVPDRLWRDLSPTQRRAVLRHELAHCRRGDLWKSLIARVLAAPHWFNPLAWWAVRRFDEAAEWACDALAPRTEEERLEFAKVLLQLCRSTPTRWSLAASVGGRAMATRVRRVLSPVDVGDALFRKAAFALCASVLVLVAWVRVEVVAREADPEPVPPAASKESDSKKPQDKTATGPDADEARPADRDVEKPLAVVDASLIEVLAKHEAKFATCQIEYVTTQQPAAEADPPTNKEERVEFARDGVAQRWFRKSTEFTNGVRTQQRDMYVEEDGKRATWVSQHNWNGLNPPMVGINQPRPEAQHAYDAQPLFGLFPQNTPLSAMLKGQEVRAEVVEGDALLQWTRIVGNFNLQYEVRLSHERDLLPVHFTYSLNGRKITEWRATQMKQSDGVWYAAEGEMTTPTRWRFAVKRFDIGKPPPEVAMRYVIPDGAWVNDEILGKRYTQGRAVTEKSKPLSITVRDVANRPIEEATVRVRLNQASRAEAGQAPLEQLTDANGLAHFDAVPDDVLYVQVSKVDELRPASIIMGDGQELTMYLTPRTSGKVIGGEGEKPQDGHIYLVTQALPMSRGEIETPPTRSRDSAEIGPNGRFEFTQDLTLRRLTDPLLFVAYCEKGRQMAVKVVMPAELGEPLNFVLRSTASVTAKLKLPARTPPTARFEVLWTDALGRRLAETRVKLLGDAEKEMLRGEAVGCLPPGKYQLHVPATHETDALVADFTVEPDVPEVELGGLTLWPSKLASLRGQPAPELSAMPMPASELKPLSALHGQVLVLNFWSWLGDKLNDHPEQTPFFILPSRFKDKPVYWIAVHTHRVNEPEALAAKVAGMRKAIWGDGPAPFASLIDDSEPAPPPENRARTATEGGVPDTQRGITRGRYGLYSGLVLIDRHGRVVGRYSQEELEPALQRLLDSQE